MIPTGGDRLRILRRGTRSAVIEQGHLSPLEQALSVFLQDPTFRFLEAQARMLTGPFLKRQALPTPLELGQPSLFFLVGNQILRYPTVLFAVELLLFGFGNITVGNVGELSVETALHIGSPSLGDTSYIHPGTQNLAYLEREHQTSKLWTLQEMMTEKVRCYNLTCALGDGRIKNITSILHLEEGKRLDCVTPVCLIRIHSPLLRIHPQLHAQSHRSGDQRPQLRPHNGNGPRRKYQRLLGRSAPPKVKHGGPMECQGSHHLRALLDRV